MSSFFIYESNNKFEMYEYDFYKLIDITKISKVNKIIYSLNAAFVVLTALILVYFNDRSSQIQRPLSDKAELAEHIWCFGHKVEGIDFKYIPMENVRLYPGIQLCRVYQERYMGRKEKDN